VLRTALQKAAESLRFAPADGLGGVNTAAVTSRGRTVAATVVEGALTIPPFVAALDSGRLPECAR
jgi:hypothetical protein